VTALAIPISPSTGGYERRQISRLRFLLSGCDYSMFSAAMIPEETIPPAAPLDTPVVTSKRLLFFSIIYNKMSIHERALYLCTMLRGGRAASPSKDDLQAGCVLAGRKRRWLLRIHFELLSQQVIKGAAVPANYPAIPVN
jgi:hypothetical protein